MMYLAYICCGFAEREREMKQNYYEELSRDDSKNNTIPFATMWDVIYRRIALDISQIRSLYFDLRKSVWL